MTIGDGTFWGCTSLTTVGLPATLTTIGNHAFSGCTSLATITIPAAVTTIDDAAFSGCPALNVADRRHIQALNSGALSAGW